MTPESHLPRWSDSLLRMSGQHSLPASYLGGFSTQTSGRGRHRVVWVLRRGETDAAPQSAQSLARVNRLYHQTTSLLPSTDFEANWTKYERHLPQAIHQLTTGRVGGRTWLHVLVPFVAGVLVRGPEFDARFNAFIADMQDVLDPDNTLFARGFELQRLLALVMVCRWVVGESPEWEILGNDVGWIPASLPGGEQGIALPLTSRYVLQLVFVHSRPILSWDGQAWWARVEQEQMGASAARAFNRVVTHHADRLVFGPTEAAVVRVRRELAIGGPPVNGLVASAGVDPRLLVAHEFEWHRCAAALVRGRGYEGDFPLDFASDPELWSPPFVVLPANLPEFPTGLSIDEQEMWLELSDVPGFTGEPYWPGFSRST